MEGYAVKRRYRTWRTDKQEREKRPIPSPYCRMGMTCNLKSDSNETTGSPRRGGGGVSPGFLKLRLSPGTLVDTR